MNFLVTNAISTKNSRKFNNNARKYFAKSIYRAGIIAAILLGVSWSVLTL